MYLARIIDDDLPIIKCGETLKFYYFLCKFLCLC